jgi:hypothetical protein
MMTAFRTLAIALAVLVSATVAAQTQTPNPQDVRAAVKKQRAERAKERCRLNHGVDCDTPEGLKEWLLLERSRAEAVREGARHRLPAQPGPAPSRP